ncbi:MAG: PAS domain-containing sensor histidine kinase [Planctomycetaceae bacterium]|nr:MAG: PAS domain-containing sensor histidine kinase [Planctomycetaceae bacterium]
MILVWFVYGLAFFVLGLVILVYPKKDSRFALAHGLWMVGVFGIIHGLNEWLDMFIGTPIAIYRDWEPVRIGGPLGPDLLAWVRMFVLPASFFWLVLFGTTILTRNTKRRRLLRILPVLLAVGWLVALLLDESSRRPLVENLWSRYLLCLPGTLLTAWALLLEMRQFRALGLRSVTRDLAVGAATFIAYGVFAGLVVRKDNFFPANMLNYETFTSLTGLPVQILRAICAIVAAWSIIRVLDVFRWESHEALRLSEARCATIASAMPVFLFMADPRMIVTFIQGKGLEVLGLRPEQIQGQHILEAFPCGERLMDYCRQALSGQEFAATVLMNTVPFEIYYSVLRDRTGAITSVVGVALDVSTEMEAQRELDEYRRKIEKHAREAAVGVLSATVARHVAEPLTVTQLVLERTAADLAGSKAVDAVRSGIGRSLSELSKARETLNRFMEMTHPEAAAAEQPIGLYQIAKRTMSVFAESALRRKLTIAVKDMDAVPLLTISPREVEQIFYHLIQRVIDAADGKVERKLTINCSVGERCVELLFCDTCDGIRAQPAGNVLGHVLSDTNDIDSLGLSVAVVKRIVTGHGGQITLEIGPENATLRVRLPATRTY